MRLLPFFVSSVLVETLSRTHCPVMECLETIVVARRCGDQCHVWLVHGGEMSAGLLGQLVVGCFPRLLPGSMTDGALYGFRAVGPSMEVVFIWMYTVPSPTRRHVPTRTCQVCVQCARAPHVQVCPHQEDAAARPARGMLSSLSFGARAQNRSSTCVLGGVFNHGPVRAPAASVRVVRAPQAVLHIQVASHIQEDIPTLLSAG